VTGQPLFPHHISRIALAECLALLISRQRGAVKAALDHAGRLGRFGKTPEWIATWIMSGVLNKTISVSFSSSRTLVLRRYPKLNVKQGMISITSKLASKKTISTHNHHLYENESLIA
jgi:hypothetical protein